MLILQNLLNLYFLKQNRCIMKNDYSEYQYTAFDKYKARRSNIKGVGLNLFQNGVRFYPEERKFQISVDDYFEFCSIQDDIDKHYDAMEARTGTKIKRCDSPEAEAEYDVNRAEHESENVAFIEKMKRKYRISREYIDDRQSEYQKNCNNNHSCNQ